jgi:hypothetical protein
MAYQIGDYPLPSFAAYVWLEGHELVLGLPPRAEHERGHQVRIPLEKCSVECSSWGSPLARQLGWKALLDILRERARAGQRDRFHVGTRADPTQQMLEAVMRSNAPVKRHDEAGNRAFGLDELGNEEEMMP